MSSEVDTVPDDADTEPEAGVRAAVSVPAPVAAVWQHLISSDGTTALLGDGARIGNKGEPWRAADGSYGGVRSYHALERGRVTWHPHEEGGRRMLDVRLHPGGAGTKGMVVHGGGGVGGVAGVPRGVVQPWDDAPGRFAPGLQT